MPDTTFTEGETRGPPSRHPRGHHPRAGHHGRPSREPVPLETSRKSNGLYPPLDLPVRHSTYDGISYPAIMTENLIKNRKLFTPRADDVLVVTYPRSGTSWVLEIIRQIHLVQNPGFLDDHPLRNEEEVVSVPWINRRNCIFGIDEKASPRVMKSHNHYIHLNIPRDDKTTRIVHVMRNPKDVVCSLYHHCLKYATLNDFQGSFDEFVDFFCEGRVAPDNYWNFNLGYLENRDGHNILTLTYEELSKDNENCIRRINTFLGYPEISTEMIEDVKKMTGFDVMLNERKQVSGTHVEGKVGRYEKMLSESQILELDRLTESIFCEHKDIIERLQSI